MTNTNFHRVAIILAFAIAFTLFGTFAPVIYASYAPQDNFMVVHGFEAEDASVDGGQHYVCFDRTVYQPNSGQAFTELYLVSNNNHRVEVDSGTMDRYFQKGRAEVISRFNLPSDLQKGEYRYLLVIEMQLADGRVTRTFTYDSETFNITGQEPVNKSVAPTSC